MSTILTNAVTAVTNNSNLTLLPNGSGVVTIDGLTYPAADGSASQLMQTNGSGVLSFVDAPAGGLWREIATGTNSAATTHEWLDGTGGVVWDDTYDEYILDLRDINPSATADPTYNYHEDGGGYITASNYYWRAEAINTGSFEVSGADSAAAGKFTSSGDGWHSSSSAHYFVRFHFLNSRDAIDTWVEGSHNRPYDAGPIPGLFQGSLDNISIIDGFKITAGGTFTCSWRLTGRTV